MMVITEIPDLGVVPSKDDNEAYINWLSAESQR